jgi:hypothetical protein
MVEVVLARRLTSAARKAATASGPAGRTGTHLASHQAERLGAVIKDSQLALQLLAVLEGMSKDTQEYRHIGPAMPGVCAWLKQR